MPAGMTTTTVLTDSLDDVRTSARIINEYEGVMAQLADRQYLGDGIGNSWNEISYAQLTASAITEQTNMDENFSQISDSLLTITPTMIGVSTFLTDRLKKMMNRTGYAQIGVLAANSIIRKIDKDGITALDGATTSLGGAGTTLTSGYISAGSSRITGNATEPGVPPIYCVLHGFQIKDISDELIAGVGTYVVDSQDGLTPRVFKEGYRGVTNAGGAMIFEDGNITIDSSDDAKGGVFAKKGLVLVMERDIDVKEKYMPNIGGGGNAVYVYAAYAYGERSSGNWLYEIYSDATAPTS